MPPKPLTRRRFSAAAGGLAAATIPRWPANAAEFTLKMGASSPMDHPAMANSAKAVERIRQATNGRVAIDIYSNSQLGTDSAMISQTISGAMQIYVLPIDLLAPRNQLCGLTGLGFAFPDYDHVWRAMDGDLGKLMRATSEQLGLYCLDKCMDHGFRHITSRAKPIATPDDLHGMKIRLPVNPVLVSLFKHLGAGPTTLNLSEVYSALQTGVVDGQENPLVLIDTLKFYEVQKHCSLTGHVWAGFHISWNIAAWQKLGPELQEIVHREFTEAAVTERQDFMNMTIGEQKKLTDTGMIFTTPDHKAFQQALSKSGYYADLRKTMGEQNWKVLEKYAGELV
jgi:tripartite ATP-independent transporter DctP family solute receptor